MESMSKISMGMHTITIEVNYISIAKVPCKFDISNKRIEEGLENRYISICYIWYRVEPLFILVDTYSNPIPNKESIR